MKELSGKKEEHAKREDKKGIFGGWGEKLSQTKIGRITRIAANAEWLRKKDWAGKP